MKTTRHALVILIAITSLLLTGCYVSKKASRPVNVSINKDFEWKIEKDPKGHFLDYYTLEQYKQNFFECVESRLKANNIFIVNENAEFKVTMDKVEMFERLTTDTVKDPKSVDKGKVYDITKGGVKSTGKVEKADQSKWESFLADKDESEKLTPFFRPGEKTADGREPGPNEWKKKAFNSHEYMDMIRTLGFRTGDVITNRVNRFIKK